MMRQKGFTIIELLVSVALLALILVLIGSFIFQLQYSNSRTKADRETLENARRAMDIITHEVKGAKSIYTSTTTSSQLSLETARYVPADETSTFIDFFLCGDAVCFKKEGQLPAAITADTVQVTSLAFVQVLNGARPSVKVTMTVAHKNPGNDPSGNASVTLNSTVSLRNY